MGSSSGYHPVSLFLLFFMFFFCFRSFMQWCVGLILLRCRDACLCSTMGKGGGTKFSLSIRTLHLFYFIFSFVCVAMLPVDCIYGHCGAAVVSLSTILSIHNGIDVLLEFYTCNTHYTVVLQYYITLLCTLLRVLLKFEILFG